MTIEAVTELVRVFALLEQCHLKHCDISARHPPRFFGIRQGEELVAVIGFEPCADPTSAVGLLRSLAVAPACRGQGLASRLVAHLEAEAKALGVTTLYLLTNTADGLFRQLGYVDTTRTMAPDAIRATSQFSGLCPASSLLMSKPLG
ncbi:MAG: GNAT family N-acetyltransferase [Aeromonadaceae bacterium]|nr:GNAT family N-acetyltransferase [Aeromonadaceae bacterium]